MNLTNILSDVVSLAEESGKRAKQNFYNTHNINFKSPREIVTETDREIETIIKNKLTMRYPDYGFLGEEQGFVEKKEYNWIVDPIDGTTNFSIHNPFFNISIALVKGNEPVMGVVHVPMTGETYYAEKGKGAWVKVGDSRVRLKVKHLPMEKSIFGYCHDNTEIERVVKMYETIKPLSRDFRKFGAGALELALVASGMIQGFMVIKSRPWDVASGILLVKESGGIVTDFKGDSFSLFSHPDLLATSPELHPRLTELLKNV